jgi:hypothetical protein
VRQEQQRYREYIIDFLEKVDGSYGSKTLITEDIDITSSDVWTDFKMKEVSLTSAGDQDFQKACMKLYPSHFSWSNISGGGMHMMYLTVAPTQEKLEELRPAVEKYMATPYKKHIQLRGFKDSTYVYYKRGLKSRDLLVLPNGDQEKGEWSYTEGTSWVPYGIVTNNVLSRTSNRAHFPGAVSSVRVESYAHVNGYYYQNQAKAGINRVN